MDNREDATRSPSQGQRTLADTSLISVTKQATGVMSFRFIGVFLGLASNVLFARLLGAELLGVYVLASTSLLVFTLAASFGTTQMLSRFVPVSMSRNDDAGAAAVFAFGLRIVLFAGALCTALLVVTRNPIATRIFDDPLLAQVLPIAAVGILPAALSQYLGGTLRSLKYSAGEAFCTEVAYKIAKLAIFIALFAVAGLRLRGVVWATSLGYLGSIAVMLVIIGRKQPTFLRGPRSTSADTRQLLTFSAAMFFVAFLNYAMSITDKLMLGVLATSTDVGIYNVAFLIANMLTTVYMGFNMSFAPVISELYHGGRTEELRSLYASLTRTVLIIVVPACIWLIGFGEDVLHLFGGEFAVGYAALLILSLGAVARCIAGSVAYLLMMSKHQACNLWNIVGSMGLNIGLNMYYIPRYGVAGAALATAISIVAVYGVGLLEVKILLGLLPFRRSYLKLLAAAAVTLPGTLYARSVTAPLVHWQLLGLLVLTYALFLGLIALMGMERDDALILGRLMGRLGVSRLVRGGR